jgi:hypothetical protein
MALAVLLLTHRNPDQVCRLLKAIYRPSDRYVLHVDRKAPSQVHLTIRNATSGLLNVDVLPSRAVRWGGRSMVEVELTAIQRLLQRADDWSHFINLSGQDFPLRPVAAMEDELQQNPGRNYMEFFRPRSMPWTWQNPAFRAGSPEFSRTESRVDRFYVDWPLRRHAMLPLPFVRRTFPSGFTWYGGSQWKVLSREACRYISERPEAQRLWRFYRNTFIPDESFFQTALLNSPLRATIVNDSRRLVQWNPDVVTFTEEHVDLLTRSDAWFARKFDERVDGRILGFLEQRLGSTWP